MKMYIYPVVLRQEEYRSMTHKIATIEANIDNFDGHSMTQKNFTFWKGVESLAMFTGIFTAMFSEKFTFEQFLMKMNKQITGISEALLYLNEGSPVTTDKSCQLGISMDRVNLPGVSGYDGNKLLALDWVKRMYSPLILKNLNNEDIELNGSAVYVRGYIVSAIPPEKAVSDKVISNGIVVLNRDKAKVLAKLGKTFEDDLIQELQPIGISKSEILDMIPSTELYNIPPKLAVGDRMSLDDSIHEKYDNLRKIRVILKSVTNQIAHIEEKTTKLHKVFHVFKPNNTLDKLKKEYEVAKELFVQASTEYKEALKISVNNTKVNSDLYLTLLRNGLNRKDLFSLFNTLTLPAISKMVMPFFEKQKERIATLIEKANPDAKKVYEEILNIDFSDENLIFMQNNPDNFKAFFREIMLKMPFDLKELVTFQATIVEAIHTIDLADEEKYIKEMSSEHSEDNREIINKLVDGLILSIGKIGEAIGGKENKDITRSFGS